MSEHSGLRFSLLHNRQAVVILGCTAACVLAFTVSRALYSQSANVRDPFLIQYEESSTSGTPPRTIVRNTILAVRSDGAIIRATVNPNNKNGFDVALKNLTFPSERRQVSVSGNVKATSTYWMSELAASHLTERQPVDRSCGSAQIVSGFHPIGKDYMSGVNVAKFEYKTPDGTSRQEKWLAPSVGNCVSVKDYTEWYNSSGQVVEHFQRIARQIVVGQPDPTLFEIPSSYTELRASEFERTRLAQKGITVIPPKVLSTLERADQQQAASLKFKPTP